MHLILLSGGSGKRLWPLSNEVRSKQFLRLLGSPSGEPESMVQRVYRQIGESTLSNVCKSVTIAAGEIQREQLLLQLGDAADVVVEPARRDTFLAIALAVAYLHDVKKVNEDEIVVAMPVDSFVDIEYFDTIGLIEPQIQQTNTDIMLIGAVPLFPSEKYGYIVPNAEASLAQSGSCIVDSFKEKPTLTEATALIKEGALWNCGVFGFRIGYLIDIIRNKLGIKHDYYTTLLAQFIDLHYKSFDYDVVEHADKIRAIKYNGKWKDLGTWETFTEELVDATMGNVTLAGTPTNTHVLNELSTPVVVMEGIKDAVVIANHEGILVAPKGETRRLKEVVDHLGGRPMQEEKRWGLYTVLEHSDYGDTECLTKKLTLNPGKQISYQSHAHRKEVWTIVQGNGILYLDGEKRPVSIGESIQIKENMKHAIRAESKLEIIEVQLGSPLVEDDIIRYDMDW